MKKNLIIGSVLIDEIYHVNNLPIAGGDILASSYERLIGGCGFNVAATLRVLKQHVDLLAPIGDGVNADLITQALRDSGLTPLIKSKHGDSGKCIVLIQPNGERSFITAPTLFDDDWSSWLAKVDLNSYANIYFDGYRFLQAKDRLIIDKLVQVKSAKFWFAPGPLINQIPKENIEAILKLHPIIHLNEQELFAFTKTNDLQAGVNKLALLSQNTIFVTLGEQGVGYYYQQQIGIVKSKPATKLVNTNGAGDTHLAGLIAFINSGDDIIKACEKANNLAKKVVQLKNSRLSFEEVNDGKN